MLGIEEILFLLFSFLDFLEGGVSSVSVSIPVNYMYASLSEG